MEDSFRKGNREVEILNTNTMVAKINYNDIKDLPPQAAYYFIEGIKKDLVKDVVLRDILNESVLDKPIAGMPWEDLSPRGVYMFFDADDICRYIGQTSKSFYERLLTQFDTTHYPGFGWNSLLSILSCKRLDKPHAELCEEDHEIDFETVVNYKLLLIEVDRIEEIKSHNIVWIEKVLLKTYREMDDEQLLNNNVGWLKNEWWKMTINDIVYS